MGTLNSEVQQDDNLQPLASAYEPTSDRIVIPQAASATQDAQTGRWYGPLQVSGSFSPPAIQRVDAQSGDFPAGAITDLAAQLTLLQGAITGNKMATKAAASDIADLATLLSLAGSSGDANTVNSLMGRLTKIRDLLTSTLGINIAQYNGSAVSASNPQFTDGAAQQGPVNITNAGGASGGASPTFTGTCTASADNSVTFASRVRTIQLHNQSAVNVPYEHDIAASATSPYLAPGQLVYIDVHTTTLHVFPSNALPINATSGLIVRGWA